MEDKRAFGGLKRRLSDLMGAAEELARSMEPDERPVMEMVQRQIEAAYRSLLISEGILFPSPAVKQRAVPQRQPYGELGVVRLTDAEYQKLLSAYGEERTRDYIGRVERYCKSKNTRYHDYYATVLNWLGRDGVKPLTGKPGAMEARLLAQMMEGSG